MDGNWPLFALAIGVPAVRELAASPEPVLMQPVMDAAAKKTPAQVPTVRLVMTAFPARIPSPQGGRPFVGTSLSPERATTAHPAPV